MPVKRLHNFSEMLHNLQIAPVAKRKTPKRSTAPGSLTYWKSILNHYKIF